MGDVGPGPLSCVGLSKFIYNYEEVSLGVQSDFPRETGVMGPISLTYRPAMPVCPAPRICELSGPTRQRTIITWKGGP